MKALLILSLAVLVSCNAQTGGSTDASVASNSPSASTPTVSTTNTISHVDNTVQHIVYDVTNGGSSYYTSTTIFANSDTFTIPHTITLNANSTGSIIDNDNYIDIELVGRIACTYKKLSNIFTFDHCTSYNPDVYWTIQAGDIYSVTDLNSNSPAGMSNKVNVVLYSYINTPRNGHINFSYDL
jgi:hypothetical protein